MCGFIAWLGIAISHYRFRKGYLAQGGRLEDLPYRAKLFPFGPLFAFALCMVITLGQNYQALVGERIDWIGLPRHLHQPAAVPGDLAGIPLEEARALRSLPRNGRQPDQYLIHPAAQRFLADRCGCRHVSLRSGSLAALPDESFRPGLAQAARLGQNAPRPRGVVSRERRTGLARHASTHLVRRPWRARPKPAQTGQGFDKTYDTHDLTRAGRWRVSW